MCPNAPPLYLDVKSFFDVIFRLEVPSDSSGNKNIRSVGSRCDYLKPRKLVKICVKSAATNNNENVERRWRNKWGNVGLLYSLEIDFIFENGNLKRYIFSQP